MTRTARRPKKEFLPATKWSEFQGTLLANVFARTLVVEI